MKNFIFLLLIFFTLSIVKAQDISYGLKAGINYGKTKSSESDYNKYIDPVIGPHFGVFADICITEKFSVQPELLYSNVGFKISGNTDYMGYEYKGKLNYLSIPIMAKYNIKDGFYLEAGPYFGYLLSAKETEEFTGNVEEFKSTSDSYDIKDDFKALDFGIGVGACYQLENGLIFDARYVYGLSDINNQEFVEKFYPGYQVYNGIFMLSLCLVLNAAIINRMP